MAAGTSLACSGGRPGTFEGNQRDKFLLCFLTSGNLESTRAPAKKKKKEIWKNDRRSELLRYWSQGEVMTIRQSDQSQLLCHPFYALCNSDMAVIKQGRDWFLAVRGRGWRMEGRQDVLLLLDVCLSVILCRHITKTRSHDLRVEGVESAQNLWSPLRQIVFGNWSYTNELWLIDWLPAKLFNFLVHPWTNVWLEDTCRKPTIDRLWT